MKKIVGSLVRRRRGEDIPVKEDDIGTLDPDTLDVSVEEADRREADGD
jgi:hypothetical protein